MENAAFVTEPVDDGGPAFPTTLRPGLTKREWFAGQALVGFMALPHVDWSDCKVVSAMCYIMADAMLAEGRK